jgi:hypothetical protein
MLAKQSMAQALDSTAHWNWSFGLRLVVLI